MLTINKINIILFAAIFLNSNAQNEQASLLGTGQVANTKKTIEKNRLRSLGGMGVAATAVAFLGHPVFTCHNNPNGNMCGEDDLKAATAICAVSAAVFTVSAASFAYNIVRFRALKQKDKNTDVC